MKPSAHLSAQENLVIGRALSELCPHLLEQMREYAFVLLDPQGTILWLNPEGEELFGHKLQNISGRNGELLFTPEDVERGIFEHERTTAAMQGSMQDDRWMMRADGSRFWANGIMYPLRGADGKLTGFAKMLRDRSDLQQQLQTLRNEIAALVERSMQKDKILAVAAHELRNPLFATSVAVDAVRHKLLDPAPFQQTFDVIDRQLQSMRRLLDDITDATQAQTGKLRLKRERLDLRDIITRALETMRPAIDSRRHAVNEVLLSAEIPVDGDATRLQQVVQNLIDNAVKYTPPGGHINIEATIEAAEAVLKIQDDGSGVAPDMQTHIFELFTQVLDPDNFDEKGLGIGLSLVKNLVLQHGGSVQVRSNGPGKGSEFTVRLPLATGQDAP